MAARATRATLVGAGGLGGPIGFALAPVLALTIVDPDVVELSNLHRQIQFTTRDVGAPKATRLAAALTERGAEARGVVGRWDAVSAEALAGDADVVIDASDDPATKFAVADWAVRAGRAYVIAAALRYGGNAMAGTPASACYRCLFEAPVDGETCADTGVLGPVVGAIGGVAAALALQLAAGNHAHAGAILVFDDLRRSATPRIVRFQRRSGCPTCGEGAR